MLAFALNNREDVSVRFLGHGMARAHGAGAADSVRHRCGGWRGWHGAALVATTPTGQKALQDPVATASKPNPENVAADMYGP